MTPTEELQNLCNETTSIRELLVALGYKPNSGKMFYSLKDRIEKDSICIAHFTRKGGVKQIPLSEILVKGSLYNRTHLKNRLIKGKGIPYECDSCGNKGEWLGKRLSLQLEHKDGDPTNNELENLAFLCPNCHSQTRTFSGKSRKRLRRGAGNGKRTRL